MSMLDKAKAAASLAGDAVKVKAIEAQIAIKKQGIKSLMSEMGVKLYPVLETGINPVDIKPVFEEYKAKIVAIEKEIAEKQAEISAISS